MQTCIYQGRVSESVFPRVYKIRRSTISRNSSYHNVLPVSGMLLSLSVYSVRVYFTGDETLYTILLCHEAKLLKRNVHTTTLCQLCFFIMTYTCEVYT